MPLRCPSCRGGLVWGGHSPLDRREARCVDCGERFIRRVGWSECLGIGGMIFAPAYVFSTLAFDLFNVFGLSDDRRQSVSALVILSGLLVACIVTPIITRRGRRLVPASESP